MADDSDARPLGSEDRAAGARGPRRLRRGLLGLLFLGLIAALGASGAVTRPGNPVCIESWGEARYRNYGYDHIVHVRNHCTQQAICDVSSSTNPEAQRFTIPAGQEIEALTFRGSPSRDFEPRVECTLVI